MHVNSSNDANAHCPMSEVELSSFYVVLPRKFLKTGKFPEKPAR